MQNQIQLEIWIPKQLSISYGQTWHNAQIQCLTWKWWHAVQSPATCNQDEIKIRKWKQIPSNHTGWSFLLLGCFGLPHLPDGYVCIGYFLMNASQARSLSLDDLWSLAYLPTQPRWTMFGPTNKGKQERLCIRSSRRSLLQFSPLLGKNKNKKTYITKDSSSTAYWNVTSKVAFVLFLIRTLQNSLLPPPCFFSVKCLFFFFKAPWNLTEREIGETPPHMGLSLSRGPLPMTLGWVRSQRLTWRWLFA